MYEPNDITFRLLRNGLTVSAAGLHLSATLRAVRVEQKDGKRENILNVP